MTTFTYDFLTTFTITSSSNDILHMVTSSLYLYGYICMINVYTFRAIKYQRLRVSRFGYRNLKWSRQWRQELLSMGIVLLQVILPLSTQTPTSCCDGRSLAISDLNNSPDNGHKTLAKDNSILFQVHNSRYDQVLLSGSEAKLKEIQWKGHRFDLADSPFLEPTVLFHKRSMYDRWDSVTSGSPYSRTCECKGQLTHDLSEIWLIASRYHGRIDDQNHVSIDKARIHVRLGSSRRSFCLWVSLETLS